MQLHVQKFSSRKYKSHGQVPEAPAVRVKAWTYLFCSGGLVTVEEQKVRRGRKAVGGGS